MLPTLRDEILRALAGIGAGDDADADLERAVGEAYRRLKRRAKSRRSVAARAHDRSTLARATRFREEVPDPSPAADPPLAEGSAGAGGAVGPAGTAGAVVGTLKRSRRCYVCKEQYWEVDADYHQLCPDCAQVNRVHRDARCDLRGRRAIVTGGRIKIGFHTALKLLRDGAEVLVTTRFPRDAARRYAAVADVADWSDRLHIHGVDLLRLDELQGLVSAVGGRWDHLDILVNNAAQTLHRPPAYHREVRAAEHAPLTGAAARIAVTAGEAAGVAATEAVTDDAAHLPFALDALFPAGHLDETGQPLDLRPVNSWVLRDGDVPPYEWLAVHIINAFAPFLLTSRLRPLMAASPHPDRYVVQVTAMEGRYTHPTKTPRHPHTNMAKASLNMLTRTVAGDYARDGIYMNSVDTGWVTDERSHPQKTAQRESGFRPPLDVVDGAARVYDPIVRGVGGEPVYGLFLKDYRSADW
jgi:NAD(P)-dependent dehydrogenase (short-subunit alcohol dehydrogenase family)